MIFICFTARYIEPGGYFFQKPFNSFQFLSNFPAYSFCRLIVPGRSTGFIWLHLVKFFAIPRKNFVDFWKETGTFGKAQSQTLENQTFENQCFFHSNFINPGCCFFRLNRFFRLFLQLHGKQSVQSTHK